MQRRSPLPHRARLETCDRDRVGGPLQRPHLTVNNKLMGTGGFAEPPKQTAAYRRGYLCGMIRGDGSIGHYSYPAALSGP